MTFLQSAPYLWNAPIFMTLLLLHQNFVHFESQIVFGVFRLYEVGCVVLGNTNPATSQLAFLKSL